MALDTKNGVYVFDDQPEQSKLKDWYDQVRKPVAAKEPSRPNESREKKAADQRPRRVS